MRILIRAALVIAVVGALSTAARAAHPFLLVEPTEYDHIRSLTNQPAWQVMKSRVLRDSTGGSAPIVFNTPDDYPTKCIEAWGLISANTMAYVYDPANSATYKNTLVNQMNIILDDLANRPDPAGWTENVSFGNVLFNSILSLDIIYNDLTPSEISTLEGKIGPLVNGLTSGWELSPYAVKGLWALYSGDTAGFNSYRQLYLQEVDSELSPDGVPKIGNGYLMARFLDSSREQKALFMDVLEYQGYHDFPRMRGSKTPMNIYSVMQPHRSAAQFLLATLPKRTYCGHTTMLRSGGPTGLAMRPPSMWNGGWEAFGPRAG